MESLGKWAEMSDGFVFFCFVFFLIQLILLIWEVLEIFKSRVSMQIPQITGINQIFSSMY